MCFACFCMHTHTQENINAHSFRSGIWFLFFFLHDFRSNICWHLFIVFTYYSNYIYSTLFHSVYTDTHTHTFIHKHKFAVLALRAIYLHFVVSFIILYHHYHHRFQRQFHRMPRSLCACCRWFLLLWLSSRSIFFLLLCRLFFRYFVSKQKVCFTS